MRSSKLKEAAKTFGDSLRRIAGRHFAAQSKKEILPCPACGKDDMVWAGVSSSTESGVGCRRCRLSVKRDWPAHTPKKCPKNLRGDDLFSWLYIYCTFQALKIWNKIPRNSK